MSLRALGLAFSLAVLAAVPASAQTAASESDDGAFVNVEGGKLWYQTCGAGSKAMVLIHDGTLHSAAWDDVWPLFCKDFHVVRYDRRGYSDCLRPRPLFRENHGECRRPVWRKQNKSLGRVFKIIFSEANQ